jgi:hypothetical protein
MLSSITFQSIKLIIISQTNNAGRTRALIITISLLSIALTITHASNHDDKILKRSSSQNA